MMKEKLNVSASNIVNVCIDNIDGVETVSYTHLILLDRYHIQMEMESENYALAIAAVGDREEGFERLCQAIEELDQEQADLIKAGIPAEENKKLDTRSMHFVLTQMMSMAAVSYTHLLLV